MLILMLVAIIPISLTGIVSTLYYQDLIKKNIWNDNLAQAKAISIYTPAYIESARLYLESLSDRPLVVKAIEDKDTGFLDITAQYAVLEFKLLNMSPIFSEAYITDGDGVIISSYPYGSITGKKAMDKPFINNSIRSDTTVVSDAYISDVTGKPTVSIVVPIDSRIQGMKTVEDEKNVTVYGAIVGEINLDGFAMTVFRTQAINNQFIYMVNGTGHVMVHNRPEYMAEMKDFNSLTAVQRVLHGSEGVAEIYNPVERDWMLVAYSPIPEYGWGVVVSLPVGIAYKPIADATKYFIISIVALMAIALALAACIGNYFSRPILGMSRATAEMPGGGGGTIENTCRWSVRTRSESWPAPSTGWQ
ncbi:cache domain-containing protein [Methanocella conradii]|uniref:cache domain-containing protein n=1 Tax=Methanocella conradii TaxID=1175444 RepID=UPI0020C5F6A5|nr:cache domain-containing protein [Methanocella conradii]